ncbi:uncharacterized protein J3R85_004862 [Psidium guajava]|nr:uncharacterized protein J3R85_004862 [Psidium guajava]
MADEIGEEIQSQSVPSWASDLIVTRRSFVPSSSVDQWEFFPHSLPFCFLHVGPLCCKSTTASQLLFASNVVQFVRTSVDPNKGRPHPVPESEPFHARKTDYYVELRLDA